MEWSVSRGLALLALFLGTMTARADDPCGAFSWDVSRERALFATEPTALTASASGASSPSLESDRLYQLRLTLEPGVAFAVTPAKRVVPQLAYAGLAALAVDVAGIYRISLDQPAWLDVVAGGTPIGSSDFQGRAGCRAPHKIVEFVLPAGVPLIVQFSAATGAILEVAITRSPRQSR